MISSCVDRILWLRVTLLLVLAGLTCFSAAEAADLLTTAGRQEASVLRHRPALLIAQLLPSQKPPKNADRLFRDVIKLVKKNYVGEFSAEQSLRDTWNMLTLMLLPTCTENFKPTRICWDFPVRCYINLVETAAQECSMSSNRMLVTSLDFMLRHLDPYSGLLGPEMMRELKITTSGKFGGIGMSVAPGNGQYVVVAAFEGSPAQQAGIKSGDTVVAIDGDPIYGLPLPQILVKVRGRTGTRITLTIREHNTNTVREVSLRRKLIRIPPVRLKILHKKVAYIRIVNFQETTAREVKRALRSVLRSGKGSIRGIVLDLRDNPGGLFEQAIEVADQFMSHGTITVVKGKYRAINRTYNAERRGTFPHMPIAVLINRGTASAAEILAGALQARQDVLVIGERSFGKASVQGVFPLRDGMALRLTTAHYFTPDGRNINGIGIRPDQAVERIRRSPVIPDTTPLDRTSTAGDESIMKALSFILGPPPQGASPFMQIY